MKPIAKRLLLSVILSVVSFGIAIALFHGFTSQPASAANMQTTTKQSTQAPTVTLIGEVESNRSYRLTIDRPEDLLYVQCPENYAPTFGYVRNVDAIRCERFQSAQ
jgi:hypothetical protein